MTSSVDTNISYVVNKIDEYIGFMYRLIYKVPDRGIKYNKFKHDILIEIIARLRRKVDKLKKEGDFR